MSSKDELIDIFGSGEETNDVSVSQPLRNLTSPLQISLNNTLAASQAVPLASSSLSESPTPSTHVPVTGQIDFQTLLYSLGGYSNAAIVPQYTQPISVLNLGPTNTTKTHQSNIVYQPPYNNSTSKSQLPSNSTQVILVDRAENNILKSTNNDNARKKLKLSNSVEEFGFNSNKNLQDNYVYQVLIGCGEGAFLLKAYEFEKKCFEQMIKEKKVVYFKINKVAQLLIYHEFHRTGSHTITTKRFNELADDAIEVFPSILKEKLYFPAENNVRCAGGCLYVAYLKLREKYIAIETLITPASTKKIEKRGNKTDDCIHELADHIDIIDDQYVEKWKNTSLVQRIAWYKKNSLAVIFEKLPNLMKADGYRLLLADCEASFDISTQIYRENLKKYSSDIIAIAKTKTDVSNKPKKARDQYRIEVCGLIDLLSQNTIIEKGSNYECTLALMVLPYIFKRCTKVFAKNDLPSWNPTFNEISKSFIYHIKEANDVNQSLADVRVTLLELYNTYKLPLNFYIVTFGPSLSSMTESYVNIGKWSYKVANIIDAVDICLQASQVLAKEVPRACNHVWLFIHKKMYDSDVRSPFANVTTILEELQRLELAVS